MRCISLVCFFAPFLFSTCDKAPQEPDDLPPYVRLTSPSNGQVLAGSIFLEATVTSSAAIIVVDFFYDGTKIGSDSTVPYRISWNSGFWADGKSHQFFARALDNKGRTGESPKVSAIIDSNAHALRITFPTAGQVINGPLTIKLDTTTLHSVKYVSFIVDGQTLDTDSSKPFEQFWFVGFWADGNQHALQAIAIDTAGRKGSSATILVTVSLSALLSAQLVDPKGNPYIENQPIRLVWKSIPTATQYQIELSEFPNFSSLDFSATTSDTSIMTTVLPGSLYGWRVKALNKLGRTTPYSPFEEFATIITFSKAYPSPSSEQIKSVQQLTTGGFILTGYSNLGDQFSGRTIKLDRFGNLVSQQNHAIVSNVVRVTSDGGFVLFGSNPAGGSGMVAKFSNAGTEMWSRTFAVGRSTHFYDGSLVSDGSILASGFIEPDISSRLGWLVNLSSSGDTLWSYRYGPSDVEVKSLVQEEDKSLLLGGNFRQLVDSAVYGENSAWLARTNQDGKIIWQKTHRHGEATSLANMKRIEGNGYILTGSSTPPGSIFSDIWVAKAQSSGDLVWSKVYGGPDQEHGASIVSVDGGYVLTGGYETSNWSTHDLYIMKINEEGNQVWFKRYGANSPDFGWSIHHTSDGGFVVGGAQTVINKGYEMWLLKTDKNGRVKYTDR